MIRIARVSTYPTDKFNKVGFHAYQLGNMPGFITYFVTPQILGNLLPIKGNDIVKRMKMEHVTFPVDGSKAYKIWFNFKRIIRVLKFNIQVILYLSNKRINIVHIHSPMYIPIGIWGKLLRKDVYITFHGQDFHKIKNSRIYRMSAFIFKSVFAISPTMLPKLKEIHSSEVVQVPNGIEKEFVNNSKKRRKQIIFVGSFKPVKGHEIMINGFELFLNKKNDYQLLLVGEGPLFHEMKQLARNKKLETQILFLGQKTKGDLIELYNEAEIFALCSYSEGFPKVILEALACGCRIISTKVGTVPDILGREYPFYIENHDAKSIAKALELISNAKNEQFHIYQSLASNYTWEKVQALYKNQY